MINEKDRITNNKKKIEFFLGEQIKVHVDKTDKSWLNGVFVKQLNDDVMKFFYLDKEKDTFIKKYRVGGKI